MDNSESFSSLYEIILDVSTHLGFSVIPLTGKRPPKGFDFSKHQTQRASVEDLHRWFNDDTIRSYGVVCGTVSGGLLVLDFDSEPAYRTFASLFPALALSYSVRTRRGHHVYLRSHQTLSTHKIPGGDLLAQGSLVVGAGSQVNGFQYRIGLNAPVLSLSDEMLKDLLTWTNQKNQFTSISSDTLNFSQRMPGNKMSDVIRLYTTYAPTLGRNNALYQAAISAARTGFNESDVVGSLALLHVTAPPQWAHPQESAPQRLQEAQATITSAYHAVQRQRNSYREKLVGIPNALREALLKLHQSTITPRLLDIFALAGWSTGRIFSTQEAIAVAAHYGLGRSSVFAVLSGKLSQVNGQRVIQAAEREYSHSHKTTKPPVGDSEDRRFNSRGRKTNLYIVPDIHLVCQICEIPMDQVKSVDPLTPEDLASEKAYRMALHRELVKRTSPELSYRWHAQRLSVSTRTARSYNAALGVIVTPIFGYLPLTWTTLERDDLWGGQRLNASKRAITPGRWLQTAQSQRYPALKGLAGSLIKKRFSLIICKRLPSRFQLPAANLPIIFYPCIWRHLDGAAPDWGGGEYDYPLEQARVSDNLHIDMPPRNETTEEDLLYFVNCHVAMPQDLTVIKGIGAWYEKIINGAGITRYAQLSMADPHRIARLSGLGQHVTPRQIAFWIDQARVLTIKVVSADDLQGWAYKDWRNYAFERERIDSASTKLSYALAKEFRDKGWLKYHGQLPKWFIQLVNT